MWTGGGDDDLAILYKMLDPLVLHKVWTRWRGLLGWGQVWTGGGGDDLAKSPHMARIGNSVYNVSPFLPASLPASFPPSIPPSLPPSIPDHSFRV